jgi:hypothetical protein
MNSVHTYRESTNINDFVNFGKLDGELGSCKVNDIISTIQYACMKFGFDHSEIVYNFKALTDIVDLVERRRIYFWIYHKTIMGELNEMSLLCFWILKFKPFYSLSHPDIDYSVIFAMFIFTNIITYVAGKNNYKPHITVDVFERIRHAFIYQDISKESIMTLAIAVAGVDDNKLIDGGHDRQAEQIL